MRAYSHIDAQRGKTHLFATMAQHERQKMPRKNPVMKTYLKPGEYERIAANAGKAGLSLSGFSRMVCLGEQVRSSEKQQSILEIIRTRADLGRLGGLLKLWLTNKDNHAIEVRRVLREIDARQEELKQVVKIMEAGK